MTMMAGSRFCMGNIYYVLRAETSAAGHGATSVLLCLIYNSSHLDLERT
jgi:hypothetical protein